MKIGPLLDDVLDEIVVVATGASTGDSGCMSNEITTAGPSRKSGRVLQRQIDHDPRNVGPELAQAHATDWSGNAGNHGFLGCEPWR